MTALERLKAKIDEWKTNYETIAKENEELKAQLANGGSSVQDTTQLEEEIARLNAQIAKLEQEIEEKDVEIENILENVEALLD